MSTGQRSTSGSRRVRGEKLLIALDTDPQPEMLATTRSYRPLRTLRRGSTRPSILPLPAVAHHRPVTARSGQVDAADAATVLDSLAEGVLLRASDGRITTLNESGERMLGLSARELEDAERPGGAISLVRGDGVPYERLELPSLEVLRTGRDSSGVLLGVARPDREIRWLSVNTRALYHPSCRYPDAALSSFSDVTAHRRTLAELSSARLENLRRLALVSEYRDDETHRHTERVARISGLIAVELGLDAEWVGLIVRAAPLHDVGKIGIPDGILLKPSRLTPEELVTMRAHTTIGGKILGGSESPILRTAAEIALTHHERWDGRGYPAGLSGTQIPLAGRIVAVADVFDAIVHARPYKAAEPVAKAIGEIERGASRQFDPNVVEAFLTLDHGSLIDADEASRGWGADTAHAR